MHKFNILIIFCYLTINLFGQDCQSEEIRIKYIDGVEVFNICDKNPTIEFEENKEYYWYTEFSGIKSTKGGSGGNLLNGNYNFYDEDGNLRLEQNFSLGVKNGSEITWDSIGNIITKTIYDNDNVTYRKFLYENYWNEFIGPKYEIGSVHKIYTQYGILIKEGTMLEELKEHVKIYFEQSSSQLKAEYTTFSFTNGDVLLGKYTTYYKNGQIEVDGQFHEDGFLNIKVGKWVIYYENGTIESEVDYKADVQFWENGELEHEGGYVFDVYTEKWLKTEDWKWYDKTNEITHWREIEE
jgi:antitoxin component YwqK of YwqJK toxin-antitoxin module